MNILDQQRERVEDLKKFASSLKIEFGWHYLLDITWILDHFQVSAGDWTLDAGAGTGLIQWYLADQGLNVISVDRMSRADLPLRFRSRFNVEGKRTADLNAPVEMLKQPGKYPRVIVESLEYAARKKKGTLNNKGKVVIYNQDLSDMVDIQDNSMDAVVSVSSLEHNSPDDLVKLVNEIVRVLKPGGSLLATLGASEGEDWYHAPSEGWCYSLATLKRCFSLPDNIPSNFNEYETLFEKLKNNSELRQNLAGFYFKSGDNGMPWGKWDPQYQPVGIHKIKNRVD